MYNKVEICGISTSQLPKLSKEETVIMLKKIKAGDKKIKEQFIQANLRLVLSVVQKFSRRTDNMDDIFQVGCIGLIKAIDNFDFKYNVLFSTYAVPMIIY